MSSIKYIGAIILAIAIVTLGILAYPGTADYSILQKNTEAKAYMDKNKKNYSICKNTLEFGLSSVYIEVSSQFVTFGPDRVERNARIDKVEKSFKDKIKAECAPTIDRYENSYKTYASTQRAIAGSEQSQLSKLLNIPPEAHLDLSYEPSRASLMGGSGAGGPFTFTIKEAESYFSKHLK